MNRRFRPEISVWMPAFPAVARFLPLLAATGTILAASACAGRQPVPLRPEPVPYGDTTAVSEPAARGGGSIDDKFDRVTRGIGHGASFRELVGEKHPALNLTRFDDVVNSSWFEHRNDRERMSPEEVARGPGASRPDPSEGITVLDAKTQGVTPGLTVEDSRGRRYILKFDPEEHFHLATSAEVIASRFYWAAGYHVPETILVTFRPENLRISEEARVTSPGGERPMTREDLRELLDLTGQLPNGRYLAVCSRFVEGTPKGPWHFRGTRSDDPNDYYAHQHRRELRGLFVVSAWLNNVDTRWANTLASYVDPGYLRHYLIDMGSSLGSGSIRPHSPRDGREYQVDFWDATKRLVTLGFYRAGWEGEEWAPIYPSVGWLPVQSFRPGEWKPNWPNEAYHAMTPADGYWGAKLVASFTDAQIQAAVEAGRLPTGAATDTLVDILEYRRDRVVEYWYGKVTPVEDPEVETSPGTGDELRLSFRDLGLVDGPWRAEQTTYRWRFVHEAAGLEAAGETGGRVGRRQSVRVPLSTTAGLADAEDMSDEDALARLELRAERSDGSGRRAVLWLSWQGPESGYRVSGLRH